MSRLGTRIAKAERLAGRTCDVTWQEAYAADDRILQRARSYLWGFVEGSEVSSESDPQAQADEDVVTRWRRQLGVWEVGGPDPREELLRRINRYAAEREHLRTPVMSW